MDVINGNGEKLSTRRTLVGYFMLFGAHQRQVHVRLMRDVHIVCRCFDDPGIGDYQPPT